VLGVKVQDPVLTTEVGGLAFVHDESVLCPRPWTEAQSAWARELLEVLPSGPVLELCSGVGHIGLLALLGNSRRLVMVDANEVACELAHRNARAAVLRERVEIRHGRLESQVGDDESFPLIIADPPWVPSDEVALFPEDPVDAIDGGPDGLGVARLCLEVVGRHLAPNGRCLLQVGSTDHVDGIVTWLARRPDLRLVVSEHRVFARGVVVLLQRPGQGSGC
jgi:methylase of polypeptide subunit release factors